MPIPDLIGSKLIYQFIPQHRQNMALETNAGIILEPRPSSVFR